jgi:CRISPR-associated Csx2 family protein
MAKQRHVLITFLGKGQRSRERPGYNRATYDFGDGHVLESRLFGIALLRHLRGAGKNPVDALLLVGTRGSDWDMLYDELGLMDEGASDREEALEEAAALSDASRNDATSAAHVLPMERRLGRALELECHCGVIEYGYDAREHLLILRRLVEQISPGDRVTLDLTHALRHLPVFGLVAALYLRAAREVTVEAVYSGVLELSGRHPDGYAPVLRLDGLLNIADWIAALQTFDKDGDYGVFAPLLEHEQVSDEALAALSRAAFLERTAQIPEAISEIAKFRASPRGIAASPGPGSLFAAALDARLDWAAETGLYQCQRRLAWFHLKHDDYLRAALFGLEAFTTLITAEQRGDIEDWRDREESEKTFRKAFDTVRERFRQGNTRPEDEPMIRRGDAFVRLNDFRNAAAHIRPPNMIDVTEALRSPEKARHALEEWLRELLPKTPPLRGNLSAPKA